MTLTVTAAADLDPALICEIADGSGQAAAAPTAWQPTSSGPAGGQASGAAVRLTPALLGEVQRRCEQARAVLRDGEPVYGVTTGMGALAGVRLTGPQQLVHQRNLLLARASGGPPWLAAADVRALFAVRLRTFLSGDAGVSSALCQRLADFLNAGIVPAVPCTGAGSAGEIIPLAHAFGPLAGIGQVLGTGDEARPAAGALAEHGLAEFALGPKEGIALLAGVPGATALAIRRAADARRATAMMEAAAGLSIAAAGAPRDPYVAACARGDDILAGVLARLRAFIGDGRPGEGKPSGTKHSGSEHSGSGHSGSGHSGSGHSGSGHSGSGHSGSGHSAGRPAGGVQAPVSFRVAGPVLTQVLRAHGALTAATGRALAGVTDSPAFLDGRFTGTAGFHGIDLAAHCDQLTAALAHAAEVSAARLHRLLDPRVTRLPAQLARTPGPDAGLVTVHKRAAGEIHALRRLATATSVGMIETSGGQEDVQSFAWEAAEKLRGALHHAGVVTACELLAGYQAMALADRPAPPGCHEVLGWLAGLVRPIIADRPFGEDIERILGAAWPGAGPPGQWPAGGAGE